MCTYTCTKIEVLLFYPKNQKQLLQCDDSNPAFIAILGDHANIYYRMGYQANKYSNVLQKQYIAISCNSMQYCSHCGHPGKEDTTSK